MLRGARDSNPQPWLDISSTVQVDKDFVLCDHSKIGEPRATIAPTPLCAISGAILSAYPI